MAVCVSNRRNCLFNDQPLLLIHFNNYKLEPKENIFRNLKILHLSLLAGIIFFTVASVFIANKMSNVFDESLNRTLQVIAVLFSMLCLIIGFNRFRKKITELRHINEIAEERIIRYRAACVVWWAMIESPGLFAVTGFILTRNYAFLFLAIFHIIILAVFMPRKDNIVVLLNISSDELARLENNQL